MRERCGDSTRGILVLSGSPDCYDKTPGSPARNGATTNSAKGTHQRTCPKMHSEADTADWARQPTCPALTLATGVLHSFLHVQVTP